MYEGGEDEDSKPGDDDGGKGGQRWSHSESAMPTEEVPASESYQ